MGLEVLRMTPKATEPLRVTDMSLAFVAKRAVCADFLKEFSIQNAPGVTEHGLSYLLHYCPKLRVLKAVQCGASRMFGLPVSSNQQLIPGSSMCAMIDRLDLSGNHELTTDSVLSIPNLDHVRSLRLASAARINDNTLQHLTQLCPNLEELGLANCSSVTDQGLEDFALGAAGIRLKHLDVARCSRIADNGLICIAKFGNLRTLDAQGCFRVSDYALKTIGAYCHGLEAVNFKGMGTLTDAGVAALCQGCPKLKVVCLGSCNALGDETLTSLSTFCPQLEKLDLFCVHRVTDDGLITLAKGCPKITSLDLSYCFRVSSDFLRRCRNRKYWKGLSELHVTGLQDSADVGSSRGLTRSDISPQFPKKLLTSPTLDGMEAWDDSPSKKRPKRRSMSLQRQDSNSSLTAKKTPVPGLRLDVAGSPRGMQTTTMRGESMGFLSLNEGLDVASSISPSKTTDAVRTSRRFGDAKSDIERERMFAELDD